MPLLDVPDKYLKCGSRDFEDRRNSDNINKYYNLSVKDIERQKSIRNSVRSSSRQGSDRHKFKMGHSSPKSSIPTKRTYSSSRSVNQLKYEEQEIAKEYYEKVSPKKSGSSKWEEELYGKEKKLKVQVNPISNVQIKSENEMHRCPKKRFKGFDNYEPKPESAFRSTLLSDTSKTILRQPYGNPFMDLNVNEENDLEKLPFDNYEPKPESAFRSTLLSDTSKTILRQPYGNPFMDLNVNEENDLEKLPFVNYQKKQNVGLVSYEAPSKPYIVIDYEHGAETVDAKVMFNVTPTERTFNYTHTKNLITNSTESQHHTHNIFSKNNAIQSVACRYASNVSTDKVSTNLITANSVINNDIMALANLFVNPKEVGKSNIVNVVHHPLQKNQKVWKIHKLDVPAQVNYTKDNVNLSHCSKADPRIMHLWN